MKPCLAAAIEYLQFGWSVYHRSYNYNQAALTSIQLNQSVTLPASYQSLLQNFTQTSTGATTSLSYPIKRSFKRVGITYSFDDSSVQTSSSVRRPWRVRWGSSVSTRISP